MLRTKMEKFLLKSIKDNGTQNTIELFKEEKEYVEEKQLVEVGTRIVERNPGSRFSDAYIERGDKETEAFLGEESALFLEQPIDYLKKNKSEFIYLESDWFDLIDVDAISIEADDVFGTYDVMLGLKLQKKYGSNIKTFLERELSGEEAKFDLMFDPNEGLWNVNIALNYVFGFKEELTINEAYNISYRLLFGLVEQVE